MSTSCVIAASSATLVAFAKPPTSSWGYVTQHDIEEVFSMIDRVGAMTWRRLQSR